MSYDYYGVWSNVMGYQVVFYCLLYFCVGQCDGMGVDEEGVLYKGFVYIIDNVV